MDFRRTSMMKQNKKWADILIAFIKAERSLMILYMLNVMVFSLVYILDSQKIITWSGAQHLRCYIIATASS